MPSPREAGKVDVLDPGVQRAVEVNPFGKSSGGVGGAVVLDRADDGTVADGEVPGGVTTDGLPGGTGVRGGDGEAVEIERDVGGGDLDGVAGGDGEIAGEIIGAVGGEGDGAGTAGDGSAGLDLVERLHGGRGRAGRREAALGEGVTGEEKSNVEPETNHSHAEIYRAWNRFVTPNRAGRREAKREAGGLVVSWRGGEVPRAKSTKFTKGRGEL